MSFIDLIKKFPDRFTFESASNELVREAEKELHINFSNEYIEYLTTFGIAIFDGHEFTGLCNGKRLDVISITKEEKTIHKYVPNNMYVVECLDIDDIVIWQDQKGFIYASAPNTKPEKIAESLEEYVIKGI